MMGFQEVTGYWIKEPAAAAQSIQSTLANMDFWNSLSEADQVLFANIAKVSLEVFEENWAYDNITALTEVEEGGIIVQSWSDEDLKKWSELAIPLAPTLTDPLAIEALDRLMDYMRFAGYID
ncbi:unnamed protein product [marine sediment metagenome]|uniref:Uncharacterized protein n=1 Tax=marine sediment metagenome TaxID=412755 RepID=X1D7H6_9ZZZZ